MRLTRSQYESAYGHAVIYFSLTVGLGTAVQIALLIGLSPYTDKTEVWTGLFFGLLLGIVAAVVAAIGSAIMTVVVGLLLAVAVGRLLRNVAGVAKHLTAYFAIGVVAAVAPVGLYVWAVLSSESLRAFTHDWLTIVDLALILALAGLSVSLAWYRAWRRGPHVATVEPVVEGVHA